MKGILGGRRKAVFLFFFLISVLLQGCTQGHVFGHALREKERSYGADMPELCRRELKDCFGVEYVLSEGEEKESRFWDEKNNEELVTHYTEWVLAYKDAEGRERLFVFDNRCGEGQEEEYIEKTVEQYFSRLAEDYYMQNFWNEATAHMTGLEEDSIMYIKEYGLFSYPDVPETAVMFQERLNYSLTGNIYFPQLRYDGIFRDFPYIMDMYLYIMYEGEDDAGKTVQRQDTERKVRELIDEMARYTGGTLNARAHVIMKDGDGYADGFSLAVLNGEYYPGGPGTEYEIALHENYFGSLEGVWKFIPGM